MEKDGRYQREALDRGPRPGRPFGSLPSSLRVILQHESVRPAFALLRTPEGPLDGQRLSRRMRLQSTKRSAVSSVWKTTTSSSLAKVEYAIIYNGWEERRWCSARPVKWGGPSPGALPCEPRAIGRMIMPADELSPEILLQPLL